jgi:peptidoglycan/xylan/chitin deacetylase (PgdA/CDA1 family)
MAIPTIGRMRRTARRTFRNRKSGILILLYHRVTSLPVDPFHLAVSTEHFEEHLETLQERYPIVKLENVLTCAREAFVPDSSIVITFDDGYNDLLHNAHPLLRKYNIPATAFISSGYVGVEREPWWDELEKACLATETLPAVLDLQIGGKPFHWERGQGDGLSYLPWKAQIASNTNLPFVRGWRERLFLTLHYSLSRLQADERDALVGEILTWAISPRARRDTHRMLSLTELRALADDDTIEIGAHTVSHVSLSSVPLDIQRREISESKKFLETLTGRSVKAFAYPYGGKSNYTQQTIDLVKELGFRCACTAFEGIVQEQTNPFELPRFEVHDWNGKTFADHLEDRWRG